MPDETNVLQIAQRNAQQLLKDANESSVPETTGETVPEAALATAKHHRETAIEQQRRARQIAEASAITVAILENIVEFEKERAEEADVETDTPEDSDEPAVVEGISDD